MKLIIPLHSLESARAFFEDAGSRGCEGTGFLAGTEHVAEQRVNRFFAPDQLASSDPGFWVEVTYTGKAQLASNLAR